MFFSSKHNTYSEYPLCTIWLLRNLRFSYTYYVTVNIMDIFNVHSFIHCRVHCCGLQMSHVSLSFQLLPLSGRTTSSHVRLGLPLPHLPSSLPSIVVSRVSYYPDMFLIMSPTHLSIFQVVYIVVSFTSIFCSTTHHNTIIILVTFQSINFH